MVDLLNWNWCCAFEAVNHLIDLDLKGKYYEKLSTNVLLFLGIDHLSLPFNWIFQLNLVSLL